MKKIVLIACVSKKLPYKAKAKDLYISTLFKYSLKYAQKLDADKIFILSDKYGLVNLYEEIEPYDVKLKDNSFKVMAENIIISLQKEIDIDNDEVIFLAGIKYRKYLVSKINNYKIPLEGLHIGKQLQYLKKMTDMSEKRQEAV